MLVKYTKTYGVLSLSFPYFWTYPLPTSVVGGKVTIDQVVHKVLLASLPVDEQVLHKEAGYDHSQAVVHVSRRLQLSHSYNE